MHFLSGKAIPRRQFVQGLSATFALPYLDAMLPTGRGAWRAANKTPRLVAIEMVHGAAGSNEYGAKMNMWSPAATGRNFDLAPTALHTLDPYREYLTIISNTDVREAEPTAPNEIGGDHFRSSAVFLTQAHPKQTQGSDLYVGTSMDQLIAKKLGANTAIPSMQLCIENLDQAGGCYYNYACAYTDTISWASPSEPLPMIRNPRAAFELLFGAGATNADRMSRRRDNGSILDWIVGEMGSLKKDLGATDKKRVDQYLENIRELERRIQKVEAKNRSGEERAMPEAPVGVPDSFEEHMKLMFDIQVLAFQADMTRVFSFKTGRDASSRTFAESGSNKGFHPASHHGGREAAILEFNLINKYHVSMLPYFLDKLKSTMEGDSNLLDKTMIVYGSPMSDPNIHAHRRCPLILLSGERSMAAGNSHLKAPDGTPMADVFLSLLHKYGVDTRSFGDSVSPFALNA